MIAILFALSLALQDEPKALPSLPVTLRTPLPVTIKVTQDVSLEPYRRDREEQRIRAMLQFFNKGENAVVIRRGRTFQMVSHERQMEGGCRIRFEKKDYDLAMCFWLDGYTDHRSDIFAVITN